MDKIYLPLRPDFGSSPVRFEPKDGWPIVAYLPEDAQIAYENPSGFNRFRFFSRDYVAEGGRARKWKECPVTGVHEFECQEPDNAGRRCVGLAEVRSDKIYAALCRAKQSKNESWDGLLWVQYLTPTDKCEAISIVDYSGGDRYLRVTVPKVPQFAETVYEPIPLPNGAPCTRGTTRNGKWCACERCQSSNPAGYCKDLNGNDLTDWKCNNGVKCLDYCGGDDRRCLSGDEMTREYKCLLTGSHGVVRLEHPWR